MLGNNLQSSFWTLALIFERMQDEWPQSIQARVWATLAGKKQLLSYSIYHCKHNCMIWNDIIICTESTCHNYANHTLRRHMPCAITRTRHMPHHGQHHPPSQVNSQPVGNTATGLCADSSPLFLHLRLYTCIWFQCHYQVCRLRGREETGQLIRNSFFPSAVTLLNSPPTPTSSDGPRCLDVDLPAIESNLHQLIIISGFQTVQVQESSFTSECEP